MILTGWWVNLIDQINSPFSKRPRLNYGIHSRCRSTLHVIKFLAFLETLVICKTIFQHCWPKIPIPPDYPLHLVSRLMGSTNTFMYRSHQNFSFFFIKASEQNSINHSVIQLPLKQYIFSCLKSDSSAHFLGGIFKIIYNLFPPIIGW